MTTAPTVIPKLGRDGPGRNGRPSPAADARILHRSMDEPHGLRGHTRSDGPIGSASASLVSVIDRRPSSSAGGR